MDPELGGTENGLVKRLCTRCRSDGSLITRDADEWYETGCISRVRCSQSIGTVGRERTINLDSPSMVWGDSCCWMLDAVCSIIQGDVSGLWIRISDARPAGPHEDG
jgi:hypothetical protein